MLARLALISLAELIRQLLAGLDLLRLFNQLVLATGGDVDEAMDWMRDHRVLC